MILFLSPCPLMTNRSKWRRRATKVSELYTLNGTFCRKAETACLRTLLKGHVHGIGRNSQNFTPSNPVSVDNEEKKTEWFSDLPTTAVSCLHRQSIQPQLTRTCNNLVGNWFKPDSHLPLHTGPWRQPTAIYVGCK